MSSTLPSNSICREVSTLGAVLGPTWVCPGTVPSMSRRAAATAAPVTILGNLSMVFSSLVMGGTQDAIQLFRRGPAVLAPIYLCFAS
jgi:hypothetical protein